ncbi:DUF2147 domain-containing protein [Reichenbachiella agarivorans]|uniref:DUF2147 domain-containing protein n=1 Tax=Reichenbachiella agarivorans TaxID=2979464 RepID=A0ABY6CTL1_9BACT|nr:DUF2147 domain-containing protein [Reichenbachiella agarivorans]UXP33841.1 DUF2147 domain-containing protein [Reichenbachiella agarivorans]
MKKTCMIIATSLLLQGVVCAQSIVGKWKTIDDESGKPKSVVEIFQKGDKYYGKVIKLYRTSGEEQDPICVECSTKDDRYKQKVIGMEIIRDLIKSDNEYEDGTILDPENGKIYDCKLWVEDGKLQVRGYISFLFRTQTWLPYQ